MSLHVFEQDVIHLSLPISLWCAAGCTANTQRVFHMLNRRRSENRRSEFDLSSIHRSPSAGETFRIKWPKAEIDRWDLAAKGDPAEDSSHLPGRVEAAPANRTNTANNLSILVVCIYLYIDMKFIYMHMFLYMFVSLTISLLTIFLLDRM